MPAAQVITARSISARFLQLMEHFQRVTIVAHDNPDPDAISTGWGLHTLIAERLGCPVSLVAGGAIVRAENRHMVDLLSPPIELVDEIPTGEDTAVVLVDCGLGTSNHLVTRQAVRPVAVIDHHEIHGGAPEIPFLDLRPELAASATIAAQYLREQHVEPGDKLASAMLYAIRTETRGHETHHTALDREVVLWLTQRADPTLLAEIESAPLTRQYFRDLALALQSTIVFDDVAFCLLPRAEGAEIVGELADMLVRCHSLHRVLAAAVVDGSLLLSVRTEHSEDNAAQLVQTVLRDLGSGGGHTHRAGGKIAGLGAGGMIDSRLKDELLRRWLVACGRPLSHGEPLVPRGEIIEHL
jgi:nanoRNase/pAp phosphatase (c-di-AMP/oligoRNAs hydrolase)